MATAPVNPVATFPKASSARTFTAGLIWWSATVVLGCVPNTSWVAAPGMILKPLLVAGFRPAAVAVSAWSEQGAARDGCRALVPPLILMIDRSLLPAGLRCVGV